MCDSLATPTVSDSGSDIARELGRRLKSRRWTIATAESCTGGGIALSITSVAGSSDYFEGSVVAYSNDVKQRLLSVSADTLTMHGAVSKDCALAMATGVRAMLGTSVGISSTGIAGPGGATARKPVGLVYIAVATPETTVWRELSLIGSRASIMRDAAGAALALAVETIGASAPSNGDDSR